MGALNQTEDRVEARLPGSLRPRWSSGEARPLLAAVAAGGIGVQVVHAAEHLWQVGHWVGGPTVPPWMSRWALAGAASLAHLADGHPASGTELLHLLGNVVFLAGLVAAVALVRGLPRPTTRLLRIALWVQAAHMAEHALLTGTLLAGGRALGVSTAFGALAASPVGETTLRVWVHVIVNLGATALALWGLKESNLLAAGSLARQRNGRCP